LSKGFLPYVGTQEKEIEALKLVFRLDVCNPYKDDAYNINAFHKFKPSWKHSETDYHTYLVTLYGEMNVMMDKYVAIKNMMRHMISAHHVLVSTTIDETTRRTCTKQSGATRPPPSIGTTISQGKEGEFRMDLRALLLQKLLVCLLTRLYTARKHVQYPIVTQILALCQADNHP
jgi:hypothetical protein